MPAYCRDRDFFHIKKMMCGDKKKIFVGLSGGVDSAVSALLLKKQGHEVIGVFMKNWSDSEDEQGRCTWQEDKRDATRVAARLDIPLLVFDFEKAYRKEVVEYMYREYAAGRTPNPDVLCNEKIKIPLFLEESKKRGADFIATGHYARKREGATIELLCGADEGKDQSYFLHRLTQEYLRYLLFPVGEMQKSEVRAVARAAGTPVAERKDSVGICFVGEVDMKEFLCSRIAKKKGDIINTAGEKVGEHEGVWYYTIGQRRGLAIGGAGLPYYVARKDVATNIITVAKEHEEEWMYGQSLVAHHVHWIAGIPSALPYACQARIRYRQQSQEATVQRHADGGVVVEFAKKQRAITAGQSVVFYQNEVCLGGGVIA